MDNNVKNVYLIKDVFCEGYTIPLYQRSYAWGYSEIEALIKDIVDFDTEHYCIGTLIVDEREGENFVVDGQQRLTTLYILLNCLGCFENGKLKRLTFKCRDKSNYTLDNISKYINIESEKAAKEIDDEYDKYIEKSIIEGIVYVNQLLKKKDIVSDKNEFINKLLNKVFIVKISVPKKTDINRYFELMNTRGEQLELQDILKADMMSYLENKENESESIINSTTFSKIWDACSDMSGYLQMKFTPNERDAIFGKDWIDHPIDDWEKLTKILAKNTGDDNHNSFSIDDIIKSNFKVPRDEIYDEEDDSKVRFESIIDFPHFLIHVLKVFVSSNNFCNMIKSNIGESIDDNKLLDYFNCFLTNKALNKKRFVKEFALCLLKTRFLFDKYIVKREYKGENVDGEWSLKQLKQSRYYSSKRAYFINTTVKKDDEEANKKMLMLQSAYRVSYTSPKVMHWITEVLKMLYSKSINFDSNEFIINVENLVKDDIKAFLKDGKFSMGVATPHIVFNYLDYLLWKNYQNDEKYKYVNYSAFKFEFRNSVEHWYPQHPTGDACDVWKNEEELNHFGNLCLLQRNINSKFSNLSPIGKRDEFKQKIDTASIKLQIMSKNTDNNDNWRNNGYKNHGNKMISILKEACEL